MKKISVLLLAALLWVVPACDDDDDSTSVSRGTLVVNYDFTGLSISTAATNMVYVYLYKVLSLFPYEYYTTEGSSDEITDIAQFDGSITLNNVAAGNYYVVVFYDLNSSTKSTARNNDPYMIYVNDATTDYQTVDPYTAVKDTIPESTDGIDDDIVHPDGYVTITANQTTTIDMDYDEGTGATFKDQGAWYIDTIH